MQLFQVNPAARKKLRFLAATLVFEVRPTGSNRVGEDDGVVAEVSVPIAISTRPAALAAEDPPELSPPAMTFGPRVLCCTEMCFFRRVREAVACMLTPPRDAPLHRANVPSHEHRRMRAPSRDPQGRAPNGPFFGRGLPLAPKGGSEAGHRIKVHPFLSGNCPHRNRLTCEIWHLERVAAQDCSSRGPFHYCNSNRWMLRPG
jgi:hypothetical protein